MSERVSDMNKKIERIRKGEESREGLGDFDVLLGSVVLAHALAAIPRLVLGLALLVARAVDVAVAAGRLFVQGVDLQVDLGGRDVLQVADVLGGGFEFLGPRHLNLYFYIINSGWEGPRVKILILINE